MWKILEGIQKKLFFYILISIFLGILSGSFLNLAVLKYLVLPLTFMMIYPMMVGLDFKKIFLKCDIKLQIAAQVVNFIFIPLLGLLIGKIFFASNPELAFGLFIIAIMPTSSMTIAWTSLSGGNVNLAAKITLFGIILGALLLPVYSSLFFSQTIMLNTILLFRQIALIIFLPMFFGFITRRQLLLKFGNDKFLQNIKPKFGILSTLGVLSIIFVVMALNAQKVISDYIQIPYLLFPIILFYFLSFSIIGYLGKKIFTQSDTNTLVFGTAIRNLSVVMAIIISAMDESVGMVALIVSLAYIIQVQSASIYLKLSSR